MNYHIITYGCQMNRNDSERIAGFLEKNGLKESLENKADIIFLNACSIRQSAIDRLYGKIKNLKKRNKKPIIVLTGCLLEKDKKKLSSLVDYVFTLEKIFSWNLPFLKEDKKRKTFYEITPKRKNVFALISIMSGCNNFCSYCVVPYTKGREFSRPAKDILQEVEGAVKSGFKEVWLLGQNVNSYRGEISFPKLLQEVNKIRGDFWIRFATSHPKDFSNDLINTIKKCKKITNYLHLPLQSGDNEILARMNRPYTREKYLKIIEDVRDAVPKISISTDIIVGFPGETEKNFRNTVDIFNKVRFDMMYIARYSPRVQTAAFKMKETVSPDEKRRREKILEELLKESNYKKNKKFLGKELKVFVLKESRKKGMILGKTEGYKNVIFRGSKKTLGNFVKLKIHGYSPWGLKGKINRK